MRRDRMSPDRNARQLFEALFPERRIRVACAKRLVDSIKYAHAQTTNGWVVTKHDKQIRLNVGKVLVLQLRSDQANIYVSQPRGRSVYAAVRSPSKNVAIAPSKISIQPIKFWKDHESFIGRAAKTQILSSWSRSFASDVLLYLEDLLGLKLPRPMYLKIKGDKGNAREQPDQSPLHLLIGGVGNDDKIWLENATTKSKIRWIAPKSVRPNDQAIIFIAGHGFYASGRFTSQPKPAQDHRNRYRAQLSSIELIYPPVSLKEIRERLPNLRWAKYPRSIYSAPPDIANEIRALIRERRSDEASIHSVARLKWSDIEEIQRNRRLGPRTRKQLIDARLGQGQFRKNLIGLWQGCAVTSCNSVDVRRASHIKPWRAATRREKLDVYNGLLLMPNLDALFDRALITFDEQGMIEISEKIPKKDWPIWGLSKTLRVKIRPQHKPYLKHHRELFLQNRSDNNH